MERKEAKALGLSHYNTGKPCKYGHIAERRVHDRICLACDRMYKKKQAIENTEHYKAKKRASYQRNKMHIFEQKRKYRANNRGKINALHRARKIAKINRTPKWINADEMWMIKEVYDLAAKRTQMTGFAWHVDHIIPLQGEIVSGLHVMNNLQVIPGIENIRKKNSYAE